MDDGLNNMFSSFHRNFLTYGQKGGRWYAGTADAIYQNIDFIDNFDPEYVLILSGDHIYKMDYSKMLMYHHETGADFTVGCIEVPVEEAKGFGVMSVDQDSRINKFVEKPSQPEEMPGKPGVALAFQRLAWMAV